MIPNGPEIDYNKRKNRLEVVYRQNNETTNYTESLALVIWLELTQPAFTYSKSTIETPQQ